MEISQLLQQETIRLHQSPVEKEQLLQEMVQMLADSGAITDAQACLEQVLSREEKCSTGLGHSLAIPHCKCSGVARTALAAVVVPDGMDFAALDGEPVRLLFMIATPEGADTRHLLVLARLAQLMLLPDLPEQLCAAPDAAAFCRILDEGEARLDAQTAEKQEGKPAPDAPAQGMILAVTGCPTGVAHTYMAAQALEQAAEEMGLSIKVETNGASGIQNALTAEEIAACRCILVAADRAVEMNRFAGRPVLRVPVSKAVTDAKALLQQAETGDAPLWECDAPAPALVPVKERWRSAAYRHFMCGISKTIPLLTATGVVGVLGTRLPEALGGPLFQVGIAAQTLVLVVLSGYIAQSISDEPGLTAGLAAGALAQMGASFAGWCLPGFVGSILGGFTAGGMIKLLRWLFDKLPAQLSSLKATFFFPVLGIGLTGLLMLLLNIPATLVFGAVLNFWVGIPPWALTLVGAVLGAMMAFDLGGPVNKMAYAAGILLLTAQQVDLMAAVMAAGMVPPIAAGLAALVGGRRFLPRERASGWSDMMLGFCFISEAALPLLNRCPRQAHPAYSLGGAAAAALSIWMRCGSPAPHGGILMVLLMNRPLAWLMALAIGVALATVTLLLLMKPQPAAE